MEGAASIRNLQLLAAPGFDPEVGEDRNCTVSVAIPVD
jgi:hypothetical protein